MITVLDTRCNDYGDVWFKVKLERNADVLVKKLYTEQDLNIIINEKIKEFLNWQVERLLEWRLENEK